MKKQLLCITVFVCSLLTGGLWERAYGQTPGRDLDIYLLIGQSNMGGRASIPPEDTDVIPGVWVIRGQNDWVEARNPINVHSSIQPGGINQMNPGYVFSLKMRAQAPDREIGLVSNARGATGLAQWMPGTRYYNEAVKRAQWAMEYGTIKGVLWHQGEQDTKDPANIPIYLDSIQVMINALREDLGAPNLPFVAGEISMEPSSYQAFNEMIQDFPGILPNTDLVDSDGLTTRDGVHFDTPSMKVLGERYADKIYPLVYPGAPKIPNVSFETPAYDTQLSIGDDLYVEVNASDDDGTVAKVDLYLNGEYIRSVASFPYEWGAEGSSDPLLQNLTEGYYTLRAVAEDNDGLIWESTTSVVVGDPCAIVPSININDQGWYNVSSAILFIGSNVHLGPQSDEFGTSGGTWSWTGPDEFTYSERDPKITNIQAEQAGIYTVTHTDQEGCTATLEYEITVDTIPADTACLVIPYIQVNGGDWNEVTMAEVEAGDEVYFGPQSDEFGADGGAWSWTGPDEFAFSGRAPRITNIQESQAGTYTVTNTDQKGCTASLDFTVTVNAVVIDTSDTCTIVPSIQVNGGPWNDGVATAEVRQGSEVWFGPQSNRFGPEGGTWSWTGPDGFTAAERAPRITDIQLDQSGTYTVTNTDQDGCTSSLDYVVSVSEFQAADIRVRGVGIDIENVNYRVDIDQLIYPKGIATRFETRDQYSTPGEQHLWPDTRPILVQGMDYATTPLPDQPGQLGRDNCSIDEFIADTATTIIIAVPIDDLDAAGWTKTSTTFNSSITTFTLYTYDYATPNTWVDIPYNDPNVPTLLLGERGRVKFDNPPPISPLAEGVIVTDFGRDYNRGFYVVDPDLIILPNGDYIAGRNRDRFISKDKGLSWDSLNTEGYGVEHASTFYHQGDLYIIGDEAGLSEGRGAITKSTDGGKTWADPVILNFGLRNAPSHVEVSRGRIWLAYEAPGSSHEVNIASASSSSDLMNPDSWVTTVRQDNLGTGNETDMVLGRDGWPIAMTKNGGPKVKALSPTEAIAERDGNFSLPGDGSKYSVKYDSITDKWWALTSKSPVEGEIRTGITLYSSTDLKTFIKERVVLQGTSPSFHGFNYPFLQFDGEDIVFVLRTAWENEWGQAQRWHDGNMLTFHRVRDFRASNTILPQVSVNDSPVEESTTVVAALGDQVTLSPQSRELGIVEEGWTWTGPNGFTATTREIVLDDIQFGQEGTYTATFDSPAPNTVVTSLSFVVGLPGDCAIVPAININRTGWMDSVSTAEVTEGDQVWFGPQSAAFGASVGEGWTWTGPDGFTATGRSITLSDIQLDEAGTYTVTFVDPNGCAASLDHTVTFRIESGCELIPVATLNGQAVDSAATVAATGGDQVILSPASNHFGTDTNEGWSWTGPNGFTATDREVVLDDIQLDQAGSYSVSFTDPQGCIATYAFIVTVEDACRLSPYVVLNGEEWDSVRYVVAGINERIVFSPEALGNSALEAGWSWTGPRGLTSTGRELVIERAKFRDAGVYEVTLNGSDGCVATHTFLVAVVPPPFTGRCYSEGEVGDVLEKWFPNPIVIYPNPVIGPSFSIDVLDTEVSEIIITSLRGDVVYQQSVGVADLPLRVDKPAKSGIYLVKVKDTQGKWHINKLLVYQR